jgi:hypothetical protein
MTAGAASPRTAASRTGEIVGVVAATAAALVLAGCGSGAEAAARAPQPTPTTARATSPPPGPDPGSGFRSPRTIRAVPVPVRLRIPSIGVDAPFERVGLARDGTIAAPKGFQNAAWYTGGPRPGQPGPAVLLGHVDSRSGPAVFYRLATLKPGARVLVQRADGSTVRFRVSGRIQVAKTQFPADLVYGPTLAPSLRLVTCGGDYDRATGHYRDNVVVSAVAEVSSP